MPTSDVWDIVKVPFPYTDRPVRQHRPALVVARQRGVLGDDLLWVLMITSAENRGWIGDVTVSDTAQAGLPAPSIVRTAKIATIDSADAERLGTFPVSDRPTVVASLLTHLSELLKAAEES
jgi:mRNA interferase MazF